MRDTRKKGVRGGVGGAARVAAVVLAAGGVVSADEVGPKLELRTGVVRTLERAGVMAGDAPLAAGGRYVVQLDGPMTPERAAALAGAGVELGQYLPEYAYLAKVDGGKGGRVTPESLRKLGFVVWAGEFDAAWKVDPELGKRGFATRARQELAAAGLLKVAVVLFEGEGTDEAAAAVAGVGGSVTDAGVVGGQWIVEAVVPAGAAAGLSGLGSVQWIEEASEAVKRNDSSRWILQSNVLGMTPVWDRGIRGEGQIGGIIDGTPRESHCMFDDTAFAPGPNHRKIVGVHSWAGFDSHGTHTSGTMVGDAPPYGVYTTNDGIALAAKLSSTELDSITTANLQQALNAQHVDGARVHSNSYGDDFTVAYTAWCRAIDAFSYEHEDDVVAFAVTNGSSLRTPENAVNVLAVGASGDQPQQGTQCIGGTGPTADGRRKPDLMAPGCNTVSANSETTCGVVGFSGTSMACPAAAGAALLVRQYYTDGFYPSGAAVTGDARTPSGALVRATLINSSVDMSGVQGYPSNGEGWGRILLDHALGFPGDTSKLYVEDVRNAAGLTTGQSTAYPVTITSAAVPLRITLVFTAPPAAVNAANPVINNLDLEVSGPGGLYRGNVFASGQSTTGGTADAKNSVEVVLLTAPTPGAYTITVRGTAVNVAKQGYALVVNGAISGAGCSEPQVTVQPVPMAVAPGGVAFFNVTATGTGLGYRWRKNGQELFDNPRISGAFTRNLLINPVELGDGGTYDVAITSACGSVTSNGALLTVGTPPCYANCDGSTTAPVLNIMDFACFLGAFAAGGTYANCDASTAAPVLNVADFTCFLNRFSAGCS